MKYVDSFLEEHARSHAAAMTGASEPMLEDQLLEGLTDAQLRLRPFPGLNSIVWLLWHLARSEDVNINVLIAGRQQVLEEDGWLQRLNLMQVDMGTGMSEEEVTVVSERVDIRGLRAYRVAVGLRTREVVRGLRDEELDEPLDPTWLLTVHAFPEGANGTHRIATYWRGRQKRFVLASRHDYLHLGEAMCIKTLVRGI